MTTSTRSDKEVIVGDKPLGQKAYGSIPHLPGSRKGPGDSDIGPGPAKIATEKARDKWDLVIIQEKLDGSCCAAANIEGKIIPLTRKGYNAWSSPFEMHLLFARWVVDHEDAFLRILNPGERAVGEWLAQAHGTIYALQHEPFVVFDIMKGHDRLPFLDVYGMCCKVGLVTPNTVHVGGPLSIQNALDLIGPHGAHRAVDVVEGAVWRVERRKGIKHPHKVDFLAKWVRPDKVDGCYLPGIGDVAWPIWNWKPDASQNANSQRHEGCANGGNCSCLR